MRKFGNVLMWFGLAVLGLTYIIGAIGAVAAAYAASGALGVGVALMILSAIPAVIVGTILGE